MSEERRRTTWEEYQAFQSAPENKGRMLSAYAGLQPWESSPKDIPQNPETLAGQRQINPKLVALIEREVECKYTEKKQAKKAAKSLVPRLKPTRIPQYIAAVARAVASGSITAAQGNGLLYAAQVIISLMRAQQPPPPPPHPHPIGYAAPKKTSKA